MSSQLPYVNPLPGGSSLPTGLTLNQFLQTVMVGVSGLPGNLVRPSWQVEPPKQPSIETNWLALGVELQQPDAQAYVSVNNADRVTTQRHQGIEIKLSIYGPRCQELYDEIADAFQIPQNRIALFQANMGFTEISAGRHIPDLVNQRWVDRVECSVFLRREIQRTYPVLTFVSASGTIYVPDVSPDYELNFTVSQPEEP